MSSLLSVELAATCNALGKYDPKSKKYFVDAFTLGTVKDLIRFLRRDGDDHEIRRHLGTTKVLQTDLVPLLIDHWQENELFDVTLRLLVNLTNPALLLYREEVPSERTARHHYMQVLSHLQAYKAEAFTKVEFWDVIAKKMAQVLEINWQERDEDTGLIIERILILIRNVLHVPADESDHIRPQSDASVHDQVLWALNRSNVLDIILYMSSENEKQYFMHILEILSHLLKEQNPACLADSALHRSVDEKLRDEQELLSIRTSEMKKKNDKIRQFSASRHSRFGGTYVMQNMKSVSDNDVICLKPLSKITNLDFGGKHTILKRPKNKRPVENDNEEHRSAFAIRLFLKEFCLNFLNGSYNPLMHYVKDVLVRAKAQPNDESYYLWVLKFFMEFNRGHDFQVGLVSETMSVEIFHYVQQQMEKYFDMIKVDKKKATLWVKRLHLALRAYKELLNTLTAMDKSPDGTVRDSAKVLKSNIFYVLEYREFIIATFLNYDDTKMPRSYLVDLVETTHLFLRMLEHFCKKTGLVVQKRLRKKNKKKKKAANKREEPPPPPSTPEPPHWEEVRAQLAAVLAMSEVPPVPPFDVTSDIPLDTQRENCVKNIQKSMMESEYEKAVGLLRAAREVWPEGGIFGREDTPPEEELDMLETIYVAELGVVLDKIQPQLEEKNEDGDDEDDNDEEEDEEEEETSTQIAETEFQFPDFAIRFCHPRVTSACGYLLERFDSNAPHTNHCTVKLLHRIAWDCGLPAMLFQASIFRTFQRILAVADPRFKELEKFAIFITRKFTEAASSEPKLFLELLFWKKTADAKEIQHGYVKYDHTDTKPGAWSEEQEEELRTLYMENQRNPQSDQDVIDWILENLIDRTRTRRSVIKKLKDLGLIFRAPTKRSNAREKVPIDFTEEEDEMLRNLWETFGSTDDPMGAIVSRMPIKRRKTRLVDRLLELGLVRDRRECNKKRSREKSDRSTAKSDGSVSSVSSDSDSGDSLASQSAPAQKMNRPNSVKKRSQGQQAAGKQKTVVPASQVAKLLMETVDNGKSSALLWLAECLEEVALDQEAEGFDSTAEGVPLVPISEDAIEAMQEEAFKKVLESLGIEPPRDEQEIYWRIPSTLPFETLRKRREVILMAVDKTLTVEESGHQVYSNDEPPKESGQNDSSDEENLFQSLRKIRETNEPDTLTVKSARKRTRSVGSDGSRKVKMHRINEDESDDDILSFAKKTLPSDHLTDTEDLFDKLLKDSEDKPLNGQTDLQSSDEEIEIGKNNKRKRILIEDDSD